MGLIELFLIAVGLSMDAFAVSVCKGLAMPKCTFKKAAIVGLWFGGFQALMPLIGYFAGLLAPLMRKHTTALYIFGALAGVFFSFVMDVWTVLWSGGFSLSLYLAAIVTAIPHTILYAVSNVLLLVFFHRPFGEKLTRIRRKYGI